MTKNDRFQVSKDTEVLESFTCHRCLECCKQPGFVYLTEDDIQRAASFLKKTDFEFVNQFCELEDRRKVVLKKDLNEWCIFLGKNGCDIHEAKPSQCQEFPVKWRTPRSWEYCEGLRKISTSGDLVNRD